MSTDEPGEEQLPKKTPQPMSEVLAEIKKTAAGGNAPPQSRYGFVRKDGRRFSFLTPEEVAELLKVSVRTLERWRANGEGPPWAKISNGRIRYATADFDQWFTANTISGDPA